MAEIEPTTLQSGSRFSDGFEYKELIWGDLIYGTKEDMQALGLGIGMAFPGELGGSKRQLNVRDARGFTANITHKNYASSDYSARISFPDRERPASDEDRWIEWAPGVHERERYWAVEYIGTANALAGAGAGLLRVEQLPGTPGRQKFCVTVLPDGTLPQSRKVTLPLNSVSLNWE